jgi:hypothetical protein
MMTPLEALQDMDLLVRQVMAAPPEIRTLAVWAVAEIDKQIAAKRNPTLHSMMQAVDDRLMAGIVADSRRGVSQPASLASRPDAPPPPERPKGTGWQDDIGFPDRSRDFEQMDAIVASQVGGPNDTSRLK